MCINNEKYIDHQSDSVTITNHPSNNRRHGFLAIRRKHLGLFIHWWKYVDSQSHNGNTSNRRSNDKKLKNESSVKWWRHLILSIQWWKMWGLSIYQWEHHISWSNYRKCVDLRPKWRWAQMALKAPEEIEKSNTMKQNGHLCDSFYFTCKDRSRSKDSK